MPFNLDPLSNISLWMLKAATCATAVWTNVWLDVFSQLGEACMRLSPSVRPWRSCWMQQQGTTVQGALDAALWLAAAV